MNGVIKNITVCRIGLPVTANKRGEQFNLTEGRKYTVLGFDGDILIENDLGKKEGKTIIKMQECNFNYFIIIKVKKVKRSIVITEWEKIYK